jgi:hypothetical protein
VDLTPDGAKIICLDQARGTEYRSWNTSAPLCPQWNSSVDFWYDCEERRETVMRE